MIQMKVEQYIPHYLMAKGSVTLQELGTFTYKGSTVIYDDLNRSVQFGESTISFTFNPKAKTDEEFIQYIVGHTKKIKSLVSSDLESFILTGKEFLNIGKPLLLKDIGFLMKSQTGQYEFTQGAHKHEIIDTTQGTPKNQQSVSENTKTTEEIDFSSTGPQRDAATKRKWIVAVVILVLVIAGVITGIYNSDKPAITDENNKKKNTVTTTTDTSNNPTDTNTNKTIAITPAPDTIGFDLIIKKSSKKANAKSFMKTIEKKKIKTNLDSLAPNSYLVYVHYELAYRDTIKQKDSLKLKKIPIIGIRTN